MKRVTMLRWMLALTFAWVLGDTRSASAAFEDIEVSPRARAMGCSWAALGSDEYAPFHNPASLAWAGRPRGSASYLRPFGYDFSSQGTLAGTALLPGRLGGVGIGIRRFGVDFQDRSLTSETTVALAHGFHLIRDRQSEVAVGWSLDVYSLDFGPSITGIDPGSAASAGISVGAAAVVRGRTRVGFRAQNVNNPSIGRRDKEELRRRVSVGLSYAPYAGVETTFDVADELGEEIQYRGGAEFEVAEFLWLRGGIRTGPNVLTAGLGLRHSSLFLDYGFSTGGGVLGETHHVGIGYVLSESR